jgi:Bacterial Ig-like domain (group 3)
VQYTGPIALSVAGDEEIQAYATETGYSVGTTTIADFTLTPAGTAAASLSLTPSASTITDQQSVSIAVAVSGATGQAVPTGSVSLTIATHNAQENLTNGAATLNIPAGVLSAGANHLTITYSGDTTYAIATGSTTITVAPVVISQPTPVSVSPGGSATAKLVLSAGGAYSGTMHLACVLTKSPSGAQDQPTCSLDPTSVTIAPDGTANTVFTVQTTANGQVAGIHSFGWRLRWIGGGGAAFAGVILLGVPNRRRRWAWMIALVMIVGPAGTFGCGGGNQTSTSVQSTIATTPGNYVFTVTGTGVANAGITTVTTVNVTVQ